MSSNRASGVNRQKTGDVKRNRLSSLAGSLSRKFSRSPKPPPSPSTQAYQAAPRGPAQKRILQVGPGTPWPDVVLDSQGCVILPSSPPLGHVNSVDHTRVADYTDVPPPTYTAVDPTPSRLAGIQVSTDEDPYAFLSSFDTVFLIDDSGSMAGRSWREVQSALSSIAPICTLHDKDGVDVYFLNDRRSGGSESTPAGKAPGGYYHVDSAAAVECIFKRVRPGGMTPTGTRLNQVLKAYLRHYEAAVARCGGDPDATDVRPINVIMITDGVPSDDPEAVLLAVAQRLDRLDAPPHQVGVQFFQVGSEPGAAEALRALDDDLAQMGGGVRDMVDTMTFNVRSGSGVLGAVPVLSADGILKTVLGAVVKRLDRAKVLEEERRSMRSGLGRP